MFLQPESQLFPEQASSVSGGVDALFFFLVGLTIFFGVLIFICSRVLAKGRALAIWLYGGAILIDSIFNIAMGSRLNYIFIGFGLLFIWQMVKFKNEWELA